MLTEIGHYFLAFSTLLIFTQSSFFLTVCTVTFTLCLFCLFATYGCSDFSVLNVFINSNHQLPVFYKISGAWSNHEGSMLLWAWILSLFCILFLIRSRLSDQAIRIRPQLLLNGLLFFFCLFLLATSNPYLRIPLISPEAMSELNPVLQDPILAIHPPLIYAGYVASAIVFAVCLCICIQLYTTYKNSRRKPLRLTTPTLFPTMFAPYSAPLVTSLHGVIPEFNLSVSGGSQDWGWKEIRLWILICWCFLTIGILLGSWWAYHELGWGGWWFWDPVENASFMPWVLSTALVHSVLHPRLRLWTVFFSFATFLLSLLGTFFVRSGILASVHSFASDSSRGLFFLIFLIGLFVLCNVVFFRFRTYLNHSTCLVKDERLAAYNKDDKFSSDSPLARIYNKSFSHTYDKAPSHGSAVTLYGKKWANKSQSLLTVQSLFALVVCAVVLCGTAAPVLFSIVLGRDVSAGAPFFNGTIIPISAALFILCILAHLENRYSAWTILFLSTVFILNTSLCFFIAGLAIVECLFFSIAFLLFHTLMQKTRTSMQLAHGGLCAFIAGIIFSNSYKSQTTQMLHIGDSLCVGKSTLFILRGIDQLYGPTFQSICANLFVHPNHFSCKINDLVENKTAFTIFPEKRFYYLQADSSTTKVAVQTNGLSDVYALIGTGNFETGWYTTVMILPFITCIWIGFFVSSLGGLFSLYKLFKMPSLYWI